MKTRQWSLTLCLWLAGTSPAVLGAAGGTCPALEWKEGAPPVRTDRPAQLVAGLPDGELRTRLERCLEQAPGRGSRIIGHRGAPLRYPEHTLEGYRAAARLGAGVLECDVTPTRDGLLLCRHDACDLHRTTNILETSLASRCRTPFEAADETRSATARCCTADFDLAELKTLRGRRDAVDPRATTVAAYLAAEPPGAPTACIGHGTLVSHRESIELFRMLGVAMAPELKALPADRSPPDGGGSREKLLRQADQLIADYRDAGIGPDQVWLQSFDPEVIRHWLATAPAFAHRVVWLDGRYNLDGFDHRSPEAHAIFASFREAGLRTIAPPVWMLVEAGWEGPVPSHYARAARAAGLNLVTWTLERSGSLATGGGWYYQTLNGQNPDPDSPGTYRVRGAADQLRLLALLFDELDVRGVFTDWAETGALVDRCSRDPA